jgi:hypothetical protein
MTRVYLNGQLITDRIDGLDQVAITIKRKNNRGEFKKSFSTELVFYGQAYNILKNELITGSGAGMLSRVKAVIEDDCCSEMKFEGVIRADAIDWCEGECWIKAQVIQDDKETETLTCMQSTLIHDNTPNNLFPSGFKAAMHPFMRYCIDLRPDVLQYFVLYMAFIINMIFYSLLPLVAIIAMMISIVAVLCGIINIIINVVNTLPGVSIANLNCPTVNPMDDISQYVSWVNEFNDSIVLCGRFHPAPFARDYIRNVCAKCGLVFSSNILNNPDSPYYNSVYMTAPVKPGYRKNAVYPTVSFQSENQPIHTLDTFLDELCLVFNAEYEIRNGVLYFERKDFFSPAQGWIDTNKDSEIVVSAPCFKYKDKALPAYFDGSLSMDGVDLSGNEAMERFSDIIEWNIPVSKSQSGPEEVQIPVGAVRARNDGVDNDLFDLIAALPNYGAFAWLPVVSNINAWEKAFLLPNHQAFTAKLLVWDGVSYSHAYIKRDYTTVMAGYPSWTSVPVPNATVGGPLPIPGHRVNYPYYIHEGAPGTLYEEFWKIDNPKNPSTTAKMFDVTATVKLSCEALRQFSFSKGLGVIHKGVYKLALINEIRISWDKQEIEVQAEI